MKRLILSLSLLTASCATAPQAPVAAVDCQGFWGIEYDNYDCTDDACVAAGMRAEARALAAHGCTRLVTQIECTATCVEAHASDDCEAACETEESRAIRLAFINR